MLDPDHALGDARLLIGQLVGIQARVLVVTSDDASELVAALSAPQNVICVPFVPPNGPRISGARFDAILVRDLGDGATLQQACLWLQDYVAEDGFAVFAGDPIKALGAAAQAGLGAVRLGAGAWFGPEPAPIVLVHVRGSLPTFPVADPGSELERSQLLAIIRDQQIALAQRDSMIGLLVTVRGRSSNLAARLIAWRGTPSGQLFWATARIARNRIRARRARKALG